MKRENLNKEKYQELLEDLCCEYCEPKRYCILKEFLVSLHPSPRVLLQLKCIDKFKFEESKNEEKDIGWTEAFKRWIDKGHAKNFAELYDNCDESEDIKISSFYKKLMKANGNGK